MDASNMPQSVDARPRAAVLGRIGLVMSTICLLAFAGVVILKPG
jgi:hypothetical protein